MYMAVLVDPAQYLAAQVRTIDVIAFQQRSAYRA
jgi:hypothetical protein